nr:hypothetical protein [Tanacetum cinerariifolium]
MSQKRAVTRWNRDKEILLAETWIEHSQDANIGKDQQDDVYWKLIMKDFNSQTTSDPRTKNMMTGKWTRMHGDCQKFNAIYKHLTRKCEESDVDLVENAKTSFLQRYGNKKFQPRKNQKSGDTSSVGESTGGSTVGSQSESISGVLSQDYRRKCEAAEKAYEEKREKELGMLQCRELEFLMIDPSSLPPAKPAIIEIKHAEIMRKYPNATP